MIVKRSTLASLFGLIWILIPTLVNGGTAAATLPAWEALDFEQKVLWATARSHIEVHPHPDKAEELLLQSTSSVASALTSNIERMELTLTADGALQERTRFSSGRNKRYKSYKYYPQRIERTRRDPGNNDEQLPHEWPVSNTRDIHYPKLANNKVITDAYALMLLASRFQADATETSEVIVQTDFNFYLVTLSHGSDLSVTVDYRVTGSKKEGGETVEGSRQTRAVALNIEPLGELHEKGDFGFLGLHGDVVIQFDKKTGIPVLIRGQAPRIGDTTIKLKKVTLRDAQA